MTTLLAILVIFACGFFAGMTVGTRMGYDQAYDKITRAMVRLEKVYRRGGNE